MIFLIGVGRRRTSVGSARIWSPRPERGIFDQVDDLDAVAARQVLLADLAQVREGAHGLGRLAGDVQPQVRNCRSSAAHSSRRSRRFFAAMPRFTVFAGRQFDRRGR